MATVTDSPTVGWVVRPGSKPPPIVRPGVTVAQPQVHRPAGRPAPITPTEYGGLQRAYDHFNNELFDDVLPDCFITYQRSANSEGYFSPKRFAGRGNQPDKHELALNPDGFVDKSDEQICQTLVHEMHHVWQHHCGKPSRGSHHNREWAQKMKENGLQPTSTGLAGGKETGGAMSDLIIPGGRFTQAFAQLAATGWRLNLQSALRGNTTRQPMSKQPFVCPSCLDDRKHWGRPTLAEPSEGLLCEACTFGLLSEGAAAELRGILPQVKSIKERKAP